ncbi:glycosyl hydrolase [Chloracidobacterium validum]|uniref:Glycosyl hydrolase n=1 Tax=Chloracidobacterium validum TaxID=2821543 RepID=A0ABX8B9T1_9BACT|nr:glycosyl hydrolase [Chloracidobacterium validum]QUW02429.1 glycosyl hydrolase [Chloracidobacterium validum]
MPRTTCCLWLARCFAAALVLIPFFDGVALAQSRRQPANRQQAEPKPSESSASAAKKDAPSLSEATFAGLKFRSLGPSIASGRIAAIAVDGRNRRRYFVGVASGGVWKTTNAGVAWTPVFDDQPSFSIGAVAMDPKHPFRIWVGTGENNSQRSVAYGDGLYRSDDDGRTWRNVGLKESEHIARILIDPRDSETVYVAAQGPLWRSGGDRGLYKTTDGGQSWQRILDISPDTGVTEVVMDPRNPEVMLAAAYQRRRHVWTLIDGGPESAIYKTTDGGKTWRKVTNGLPAVHLGRIGLAISPANPDVVYASVEAADGKGGVFRSLDGGETWERRNPFDQTAMYFSTIVADPRDVDRVYVLNVFLMVSNDGGKTLSPMPGMRHVHVDHHVLWIDPADPDYYLVGCDGGVYESFDRGQSWQFKANLPVTQFYDVTVDNSEPFYFVYGGTQDNNTLGGPSRTRNAHGITNADWFVTVGGDGFHVRVDPTDPNTVYCEYQYGNLFRFDRRTGERVGIQPKIGKDEPPLRWNWDSPFIISPHNHKRLYFAANRLFRSDDRGDSWRAVSGDLTRQLDRDKLPVFGQVWGPDAVAKHASTSFYGNITTIAESPKRENVLFVGTDDGLVHISEDGGKNWRTVEKFPGVPEQTFVSRVTPSQHDADVVYVAFDNHKNADFKPYLLKSSDLGRTWTPCVGNLPERGSVKCIVEDPVNPNLLFVGTEFGLFFTPNGGGQWLRLKGGLPTIAVRDIAIQTREHDLVIATFGRGFYVLDDYRALRMATEAMLQQPAQTFPVRDAHLYVEAEPFGGGKRGFQGDALYVADNPPFGAVLTYYLKESPKTKKQRRQEAEKKGAAPYPTRDDLRAEAEEEAPETFAVVLDDKGGVVRRVTAPHATGFNRVAWDLRAPAPQLPPPSRDEDNPFARRPAGWFVPPGTYTMTLYQRVDGVTTQLGTPQSFQVRFLDERAAEDVRAFEDFHRRLLTAQRTMHGALETAQELQTRLNAVKRAIVEAPAADLKLLDETSAMTRRMNALMVRLRGDRALQARNENTPPGLAERLAEVVSERSSTLARPTQTHEAQYAIVVEGLRQALDDLRGIAADLERIEKTLDSLGAPHTPGRFPAWPDR